MLLCAFGGVVIGAAIGFFFDPAPLEMHRGQADLVVKPSYWHSPALAGLGGDVFAPATPSSLVNRIDTMAYMRDVAEAVVQHDISDGLAGSAIATEEEIDAYALRLQNRIQLEPLDEQGLIRVHSQSPAGGEEAARMAEFAVRVLVKHTQMQWLGEQQQAYDLVKRQLGELRNQLDEAETRQWAFREEMGFKTHSQLWTDLEQKNANLVEARVTRDEVERRLQEVDAALAANNEALPEALGNVTEGVVRELLEELDGLRRQQLEMEITWTTAYPPLQAVKEEMAEKQQAVLVAIRELNGGSTGGSSLWERRQQLYRQKLDLNQQLTGVDIQIATLDSILKDMVTQLPELADESFEYEQMQHEAQQVRSQFDRMLEREFELKTALNRVSATVERRNAVLAMPPEQTRTGTVVIVALAGAAIGFLIGFTISLFMELGNTKIKDHRDIVDHLHIEVLGTIPRMKFGKNGNGRRRKDFVVNMKGDEPDSRIITRHDPKSPISEAYRHLRTNFEFATLHSKPKSVMITSSIPGEGKTTTAVNFAVTMADRGLKVLIVDTDMRRPNVHRVMKMERGPGLADAVRGDMQVDDVIRETDTPNLSIISSGKVPPNPSELIASDRMKSIMGDLCERFDLVVCDAPSSMVVTDPQILASIVDTVLLVVAVNRAGRDIVQHAKKLLISSNAKIAGAVVNGLAASTRNYYYYYYYYDEHRFGGRPMSILDVWR